jgi:uncharacterized protein Veg
VRGRREKEEERDNKKKEEEMENVSVGLRRKKGRKRKNEKREYVLNVKKTKFFVNLSKDKKSLEMIFDLLLQANKKELGREVLFQDMALYALGKLNNKDIEKIQDDSLSEMERVQQTLKEHNSKNGTSLELGEFLVKKLNIN